MPLELTGAPALRAGARLRPARLYLGRQAIEWRPGGPAGAPVQLALPEGGALPAAQALRDLLAAHPGRTFELRLSHACCRLLLLPWLEQLSGPERWRNYARARFEERYGEDAGRWDLQLGLDLPGCERIAVAWPRALREALSPLAALRSVRADLPERLGELLRSHPRFTGALLEIEADGAGMLLLSRGQVRRVRSCRFEDADGLASALRAEWAALCAQDGQLGAAARTLALATPFGRRDAARAQAIARLAPELGFGRSVHVEEDGRVSELRTSDFPRIA
jgi:hypothetical protein